MHLNLNRSPSQNSLNPLDTQSNAEALQPSDSASCDSIISIPTKTEPLTAPSKRENLYFIQLPESNDNAKTIRFLLRKLGEPFLFFRPDLKLSGFNPAFHLLWLALRINPLVTPMIGYVMNGWEKESSRLKQTKQITAGIESSPVLEQVYYNPNPQGDHANKTLRIIPGGGYAVHTPYYAGFTIGEQLGCNKISEILYSLAIHKPYPQPVLEIYSYFLDQAQNQQLTGHNEFPVIAGSAGAGGLANAYYLSRSIEAYLKNKTLSDISFKEIIHNNSYLNELAQQILENPNQKNIQLLKQFLNFYTQSHRTSLAAESYQPEPLQNLIAVHQTILQQNPKFSLSDSMQTMFLFSPWLDMSTQFKGHDDGFLCPEYITMFTSFACPQETIVSNATLSFCMLPALQSDFKIKATIISGEKESLKESIKVFVEEHCDPGETLSIHLSEENKNIHDPLSMAGLVVNPQPTLVELTTLLIKAQACTDETQKNDMWEQLRGTLNQLEPNKKIR